ncbi:MAG: ribonuclease Z [Gemmatimonadota bacterium]|nr:ribonuclease Z [Gemmatimonadota bacterium]
MKITILGSGTLVPLPDRGTPGLIVETAGEKLLLDSGSGTLYRAALAGVDWKEFSHVFYSHYHPDHSLDLVSLCFTANHFAETRASETGQYELNIYGPPGLKEFFESICRAWPAVRPKNYRLFLRELSHGQVITGKGGWTVEPAAVSHGRAAALAYGISDRSGKMVYSGDTEYCDNLAELCRGASLLVCECSSGDDDPIPGHLTPAGVSRLARESGAPRVLITHVYPSLDPEELASRCREGCSAKVELARDMETYEV